MKRRTFLMTGLSALSLQALANSEKKKIAFIGDSITFSGGYIDYLSEKPEISSKFELINFGKNSETVSGLSEAIHDPRRPLLFDRLNSILAEGPFDICFLYYGINDGIYSPFDPKRFKAYKKGIAKAVKIIAKTGAKVILLTPTSFMETGMKPNGGLALDSYSYKKPYFKYDSEVISKYAAFISNYKSSQVFKTIDTYHPVLGNSSISFGKDRIHPLPAGHKVIAETILKEIDWSGL
ncbi:GDSL-type esterase/lipase family protein [uncultured Arcticibacterium sp.]|uniref:GDSL-type esterase/lipase family protein n=1 Tax=uncultured Arcticibacterium sp. TaxID=2173042 RepID=UPI0030FBFF84